MHFFNRKIIHTLFSFFKIKIDLVFCNVMDASDPLRTLAPLCDRQQRINHENSHRMSHTRIFYKVVNWLHGEQ